MNFTPFFYQVQSIIESDNDIELLSIIKNPDLKEDFHSYYEDFLHCTYPDRFKCLYVLMNEVNKRYNVHSVFSLCFKEDNTQWLSLFLETLNKKTHQFNQPDSIDYKIISKNVFTMSLDMDYFHLSNSSEKIWELMFKHNNLNLFRPHMLVSEIFEHNQLDKLSLLDTLCHEYHIEFPIKTIISNAFAFNHLEIVEHYLQKYQPQFDTDDTTDLLNSVALHGNKEIFQYFIKHFLILEDFNVEQISLSFNAGLIVNNTEILSYVKDTYNIDFYPQDKILKSNFIKVRHTMWEDNNENIPSTLELVKNVNNLFELYGWDKNDLMEEIKYFSEIKKLFDNLILHNKLQEKLSVKNISTVKGKI